jgi:hypothetical protein
MNLFDKIILAILVVLFIACGAGGDDDDDGSNIPDDDGDDDVVGAEVGSMIDEIDFPEQNEGIILVNHYDLDSIFPSSSLFLFRAGDNDAIGWAGGFQGLQSAERCGEYQIVEAETLILYNSPSNAAISGSWFNISPSFNEINYALNDIAFPQSDFGAGGGYLYSESDSSYQGAVLIYQKDTWYLSDLAEPTPISLIDSWDEYCASMLENAEQECPGDFFGIEYAQAIDLCREQSSQFGWECIMQCWYFRADCDEWTSCVEGNCTVSKHHGDMPIDRDANIKDGPSGLGEKDEAIAADDDTVDDDATNDDTTDDDTADDDADDDVDDDVDDDDTSPSDEFENWSIFSVELLADGTAWAAGYGIVGNQTQGILLQGSASGNWMQEKIMEGAFIEDSWALNRVRFQGSELGILVGYGYQNTLESPHSRRAMCWISIDGQWKYLVLDYSSTDFIFNDAAIVFDDPFVNIWLFGTDFASSEGVIVQISGDVNNAPSSWNQEAFRMDYSSSCWGLEAGAVSSSLGWVVGWNSDSNAGVIFEYDGLAWYALDFSESAMDQSWYLNAVEAF